MRFWTLPGSPRCPDPGAPPKHQADPLRYPTQPKRGGRLRACRFGDRYERRDSLRACRFGDRYERQSTFRHLQLIETERRHRTAAFQR